MRKIFSSAPNKLLSDEDPNKPINKKIIPHMTPILIEFVKTIFALLCLFRA